MEKSINWIGRGCDWTAPNKQRACKRRRVGGAGGLNRGDETNVAVELELESDDCDVVLLIRTTIVSNEMGGSKGARAESASCSAGGEPNETVFVMVREGSAEWLLVGLGMPPPIGESVASKALDLRSLIEGATAVFMLSTRLGGIVGGASSSTVPSESKG